VRGHVVIAFERMHKKRIAVGDQPFEKRLQRAARLRLSQKFFYWMGAQAKGNLVGRTRLRAAAKANSFCHHRAS
jgi:hypothetical protein